MLLNWKNGRKSKKKEEAPFPGWPPPKTPVVDDNNRRFRNVSEEQLRHDNDSQQRNTQHGRWKHFKVTFHILKNVQKKNHQINKL